MKRASPSAPEECQFERARLCLQGLANLSAPDLPGLPDGGKATSTDTAEALKTWGRGLLSPVMACPPLESRYLNDSNPSNPWKQ